jgi:predicted NBD/HSP70 family sugar kinase
MINAMTNRSDRIKAQNVITAKPQTVRHVNRAAVLDLIRQHQPLSRADLARLTGIHRSNISIIVEELQKKGLLREERSKGRARGRTPTLISLNRGSVFVLGVNLRRTRTTMALASLDGHVEASYSFETPDTPEAFVQALVDGYRTVTRDAVDLKASARSVSQMVVSIPGILDQTSDGKSTIWTPGLEKYSGADLASMLRKQLGVPCLLANNAGIGAMAALHAAEERGAQAKDFVFLVIGDVGVGSGVVIHRSLYSGYDAAYAGEVGHTVIDPRGPICNCGRRGCWQLYICDTATWKRYNRKLEFTPARFAGFLDAVNQGSPKAVAVIKEMAEYLGLGISNIALTLNPERILLAGAVTAVWPALQKELKSVFFLPHHHALIQPIDVPADSLFLKGAIERAIDMVLSASNVRSLRPAA